MLAELNSQQRIPFRYCGPDGETGEQWNPNGSRENIAGVLSEGKNVLGMMPHPERAAEAILGGEDGKLIFDCLNASYAEVGW